MDIATRRIGFMAAVVAQQYSTRLKRKTIEVVGLNPTGCWLFSSLLLPINSASLIQVPRGGATPLFFQLKKCFAMQLEANEA